MSLTIQEVEHIASLARLQLSDSEKHRYREQLSAILDHIAQLQKLNTSAGPALVSPESGSMGSTLREDEVLPGLATDVLLATAAEIERAQFKIPPVFE